MTLAAKIFLTALLVLLAGGLAFGFNNLIGFPDQYVAPPFPLRQDPPPKRISLFFGGDIMLSRNVGSKIIAANDPTLPFQNIKQVVEAADLSFANLESPFNDKGPRLAQGLIFKAEPNTVEGLTYAGFDALSTANNHSFDQGKEGVEYTLNWLASHGITPVGTGLDCHDGVIKEIDGLTIGLLAYSYSAYNDGGRVPDPLVCNWNAQEQVISDIQTLRPKVDLLIVSSHMGAEYKREPEEENAIRARAAVDAGADLFIGHHPHWIQTIEQYKGKYIFYSLGNLVFDQMWSQDTMEGLTVSVLLEEKNISRIKLMPVITENYCCPRWATDEETKIILQKINLTSPVLIDKT